MRTKRIVYIFLYIVWILVIFAMSMQTGSISTLSSKWYVELLTNFFANFNLTISSVLLTTIVRKGAHFTEYAILGFITQKNVEINHNMRFYISGLVPFGDEYLQTFIPGRSGMLSDSLIDLAGFLTGILIAKGIEKRNAI
jgi:VanZ family protein